LTPDMVLSGTPASDIFVAAVCLRSCSRQLTLANFCNVPQDVVNVVVGLVGSFGSGLPNGKR